MQARKRCILAICCLTVLLIIAFLGISNSPGYLYRRTEVAKSRTLKLFTNEKETLDALAAGFYEAAKTSGTDQYYDPYRTNLPEELRKQAEQSLKNWNTDIDNIYVGGMTAGIYPQGACVFRQTILFRNPTLYGGGIYAWVDLVYAPEASVEDPNWYQGFSKLSEQLSSDWYIVVMYGY